MKGDLVIILPGARYKWGWCIVLSTHRVFNLSHTFVGTVISRPGDSFQLLDVILLELEPHAVPGSITNFRWYSIVSWAWDCGIVFAITRVL